VREIQRGSHAAVWLVRKRQTNDEFAMKVIDKNRGRLHRLTTERKVDATHARISGIVPTPTNTRLHCLTTEGRLLLPSARLQNPQSHPRVDKNRGQLHSLFTELLPLFPPPARAPPPPPAALNHHAARPTNGQ
jgi:hypothetical protein